MCNKAQGSTSSRAHTVCLEGIAPVVARGLGVQEWEGELHSFANHLGHVKYAKYFLTHVHLLFIPKN